MSLLLDQFDRLSLTVDSVGALRRFVLDLAVRGKLVPRSGGADAGPTPGSNGFGGSPPYPAPSGWKWRRLDEVGKVVGGGTPPSKDIACFAPGGAGIPWLTPADLGKDRAVRYVRHGTRDITQKGLASSGATLLPPGTVLFTSRAPIGYVAIAANKVTTNQGFKSFVPSASVVSEYAAIVLRAFAPEINARAPGTTFKEVSGKIVSALLLPLPPAEEQQRIVAKVDELMTVCDELEAAKAELEARRSRLRAASLATVVTPWERTEAQETARFFLAKWQRSITKSEHVADVRRTILDLAVRGRLVSHGLECSTDSEALAGHYPLPRGWRWTTMERVCTSIVDGDHQAPPQTPEGIPFLVIGNVRKRPIDYANARRVPPPYFERLDSAHRAVPGDILYTLVGATLGEPIQVTDPRPFCVQRHIGIIRPSKHVDTAYLFSVLRSGLLYDQAVAGATGTGQKTVSLRVLRSLTIPLPPLAEQQRIIAKLDELMASCDELETGLRREETSRLRAWEALLADGITASAAVTEVVA